MVGTRFLGRLAGRSAIVATALLLAALIALRGGDEGAAQAAPADPGGAAERVGDGQGGFKLGSVSGFESPVYVTGPKRARGIVYVVEQGGTIRMIKGGKRLGGAFLKISNKVEAGGERGLLSVAFPQNFRKSKRFYVFYTRDDGDLVVEEYRARTPRKAKPKSGRTVIVVEHSENSNHNGGQLQFGPDGDLYISTGDGGGGGDPPENAQNKNSLLGKILRIDPRKPKAGKGAYSIPASNPFVGKAGADEVFSYGLRNPFRFSFDGKRIAIGDVGQSAREEVDYESLRSANGANFGWDAFEGTIRYADSDASPPPAEHELPIFDYSHASGGCSITGGYVSRDKRIKSLYGRYIYADFCKGDIRSLIPSTKGARNDRSLGLGDQSGLSSFGEDSRNRIWFTNLNSGRVFLIKPK